MSLFFVGQVNAYGVETHGFLSKEVIDFYNRHNPNDKLSEDEAGYLIDGSMHEDTHPRFMNHFYDPVNNRGLADGIYKGQSAKRWAQDEKLQKKFVYKILANVHSTGSILSVAQIKAIQPTYSQTNFTWQKAVDLYARGEKEQALFAFGHVLHLIEDSAVPDHVRNDSHPDFDHGGSPYENWTKKFNLGNPDKELATRLSKKNPIILGGLDEYFDGMANYANNNFYSRDSIDKYELPKPDYFKELNGKNFGWKKDKEFGDYRLILREQNNNLSISISLIPDYWNRLSVKAVQHGAGLLNLFFKEAEIAKADYELEKAQRPYLGTLIAGFTNIFGGNSNDSSSESLTVQSLAVQANPTATPLRTPTPTPISTPTPSRLPASTSTPAPIQQASVFTPTPASTPTLTPAPTATPISTPWPSSLSVSGGGSSPLSPTPLNTPTPTPIPSVSATPDSTPSPSSGPTSSPQATPSVTPTPTPSVNIEVATGLKSIHFFQDALSLKKYIKLDWDTYPFIEKLKHLASGQESPHNWGVVLFYLNKEASKTDDLFWSDSRPSVSYNSWGLKAPDGLKVEYSNCMATKTKGSALILPASQGDCLGLAGNYSSFALDINGDKLEDNNLLVEVSEDNFAGQLASRDYVTISTYAYQPGYEPNHSAIKQVVIDSNKYYFNLDFETLPPSKPNSISFDFDSANSKLKLSWDKSTDLDSPDSQIAYYIKYNNKNGGTKNNYFEIAVEPDKEYKFEILAVDELGNLSETASASYITPDVPLPYKLTKIDWGSKLNLEFSGYPFIDSDPPSSETSDGHSKITAMIFFLNQDPPENYTFLDDDYRNGEIIADTNQALHFSYLPCDYGGAWTKIQKVSGAIFYNDKNCPEKANGLFLSSLSLVNTASISNGLSLDFEGQFTDQDYITLGFYELGDRDNAGKAYFTNIKNYLKKIYFSGE